MESIVTTLASFWYLWLIVFIAPVLTAVARLLKPKVKGFEGEKMIQLHLASLDKRRFVSLHDILLMTDRGTTTQIDHIVISTYAIFVIETKNYTGWISGYEKSREWTQTIYKVKNRFMNPIRQNYGHMRALDHFMASYPDLRQVSIIAFPGDCDLKVKATTDVVKYGGLVKAIRRHCVMEVISFEDVLAIRDAILAENIEGRQARKEHVRMLKARRNG